jgi:hypothetical protein
MATSPQRIEQLIDDHDRYTAVAFVGAVLIAISGILGGLGQQDLMTGTHYLSGLAGVEGALGTVVLGYGLLRRYLVQKELDAAEPKGSASAAGAGP